MAIPNRNSAGDDADYYGTLGLGANATEDQIRQAYRQLARKYHPDIAGERGADMMKRLNAAYATLSDPSRRREYDLHYGFAPHVSAAPDLVYRPTPSRPRPGSTGQVVRQSRSEAGPLRLYRTIEGLDGPISALAFAQQGDQLGVATSDGHIELWTLQAHQRIASFRLHSEMAQPGVVRDLRLSPNGRFVMAWGLYHGVQIWNVGTRQTIWKSTINGPSGAIDGVLFDTPAFARMALPAAPLSLAESDPFKWTDTGHFGTDVLTRPLETSTMISPLWSIPLRCEEPHAPGTRGPRIHLRSLSWDGELLFTFATGPAGGAVQQASILRLWSLKSHGRVAATQPQPAGQIVFPARALGYPVAVSALGFIVALHLEDRAMRLYDVRYGKHVDLLTGPLPQETIAALSPDGALLALAPPDGTHIVLWATATGQRIQSWELPSPVATLSFAQPGQQPTLAIARVDGICEVWAAG